MFNATDIPVNGFIHHVALHDGLMSGALADLATRLVSGAPGYAADKARLSGILGVAALTAAAAVVPQADAPAGAGADLGAVIDDAFEAEVQEAVSRLGADEVALIQNEAPPGQPGRPAAAEAAAAEAAMPEAISLDTPVRFVRWAKLFCQSRVDLATLYYRFFSSEVGLAVPMLVDLSSGLNDKAQTTLAQQVELFGMLSQASMRGLIPGAPQLRLHPFVGFDPMRALADGAAGTTVALVKDAVLNKGFIGVKVYPEMGWSPFQNTPADAGTPERAQALDAILDDFFGWCADEQVPVTAHCNHSNYPSQNTEAANYGSPDEWLPVLAAHPGLRLNLGHFGGAYADPAAYDWTWKIARGMATCEGLYADVGCQHVDDAALMQVHFGVLEKIAGTCPKMADRLMFGTDWYMEANNPNPNAFLDEYKSRYLAAFGAAQTAKFMSANALSFLGFGAGNVTANGQRLRQRYRDLGVTPPSWLGAGGP
ncbi:MAG: amidohydrolase family protein [Streptosporangiaceae bacterium]